MSASRSSGNTDKRNDEPLLPHSQNVETFVDDDDSIEITFTWLDYLRMLFGLVILFSVICKLSTGHWVPYHSSKIIVDLSVPKYWESHGELPIPFHLDDLAEYSGISENERILLSVKGHVFDVTTGSSFYGKWGAYKKFTGTDCSNIFGYPQWDLSALTRDCSPDLSGLADEQLERVDAWLEFFQKKYPEIGYVIELTEA